MRKIGALTALATGSVSAAILAAAPIITAPLWLPTPAQARAIVPSFAPLIEEVSPAVVQITAKRAGGPPSGSASQVPEELRRGPLGDMLERFLREHGAPAQPQMRPSEAIGSGFIVDAAGYIVTNNHVVGNATSIKVTLKDGRSFDATLVGADNKTDLAVIRVEAAGNLPVVRWGESNQTRVGDWVLAVGNPFGLSGSVTAGIVSARGRDIGAGPYDDFIQIDAPLNSGNSGGPLFDQEGRVVGVNTAIFSPNGGNVGIGFAIPSETAKTVVADLQTKGRVERGWLGVGIQPVTAEIAESLGLDEAKGALIASVVPESPAAHAGIKVSDVILSFANAPIETVKDLTRSVAAAPRGSAQPIEVWRQGHTILLNATIADASTAPNARMAEAPDGTVGIPALGLQLAPVTAESRRSLGLNDATEGAVIVAVDPQKDAAEKGLRPGDLITRVNQHPVITPDDVARAVEAAAKKDRKRVMLMVERNQQSRFVAVELPKA
jgi:serine protease Do